MKNKMVVTVCLVIISIGAVLGIRTYKQLTGEAVSAVKARSKGPQNAPIKIVEFIDFQCPACAQGAMYINDLFQKNPEKLHVQLKYFPLRMHRHAITASLYAECAAQQNAFWPFHDMLIENQSAWSGVVIARPYFMSYAEKLSLDKNQLISCVDDDHVRQAIMKDQEEGRKKGLRSTPTYFVNGEMVVGPEPLKKKLNELLQDD